MLRTLLAPVLACAMVAGAWAPAAAAASRADSWCHRIAIPLPGLQPAFESSIQSGEVGVQPERPLVLEATLPSHLAAVLARLVKNGLIALEDRCEGETRVVTGSVEVSLNPAARRNPTGAKRIRLSFLPAGGWKPGALHAVTLHAGRIAVWKASFSTAPIQPPPEPDPESDPQPDPEPEPEPDPGDPPAPQPDVYTLTGRFGWGVLDPDTITFSVSKRTTITVSYNSLETVNTQYHQERLYFVLTREGESGRKYRGGGEYQVEIEPGNYAIRASSSLGASRATMTVTVPRD